MQVLLLKLLHCVFKHLNFPQVRYLYLRPYSKTLADVMQMTTGFIHACKVFYKYWITLITDLKVVVNFSLRRIFLHCWTSLWDLFYVWPKGTVSHFTFLLFFSMTTFSIFFPSFAEAQLLFISPQTSTLPSPNSQIPYPRGSCTLVRSTCWWQLSAVGVQSWGWSIAGACLGLHIYPC